MLGIRAVSFESCAFDVHKPQKKLQDATECNGSKMREVERDRRPRTRWRREAGQW